MCACGTHDPREGGQAVCPVRFSGTDAEERFLPRDVQAQARGRGGVLAAEEVGRVGGQAGRVLKIPPGAGCGATGAGGLEPAQDDRAGPPLSVPGPARGQPAPAQGERSLGLDPAEGFGKQVPGGSQDQGRSPPQEGLGAGDLLQTPRLPDPSSQSLSPNAHLGRCAHPSSLRRARKCAFIPQDVARLASGHFRTGSADQGSGTGSACEELAPAFGRHHLRAGSSAAALSAHAVPRLSRPVPGPRRRASMCGSPPCGPGTKKREPARSAPVPLVQAGRRSSFRARCGLQVAGPTARVCPSAQGMLTVTVSDPSSLQVLFGSPTTSIVCAPDPRSEVGMYQ